MQATHCPLCFEPLEVREVAPCMECGHDPAEIEQARAGKHTYAEYRIFGDLSLVLCNFCDVDFSKRTKASGLKAHVALHSRHELLKPSEELHKRIAPGSGFAGL